MDRWTVTEFHAAAGVEDWRVLDVGASAWFEAPSLTAGAALVRRIAELAGSDGPPDGALSDVVPDMDLRPGGVRVRVGAPGSAELARADVERARAISAAARDVCLTADPAVLQTVRLGIDADDPPSLTSFWETVLAYDPVGADRLGDPSRRNPAISFRRLEEPRPLRNRVHVDVVRAPEEVDAVRAALGLHPYGVYQLTLADADGNEVDLVPGDPLTDGQKTADWRVLFSAMTFYPVATALEASELASAVAGLADDAGIPMLVDLRPEGVTIDSGKDQWDAGENPSASGFVDLAARIQAAAHDLGHRADTTRLRFVQLAIDAVDIAAVRAFWASLLGYRPDPRTGLTDIYDPRRLDPVLLFQHLDASDDDRRRQRNRIHLDLVVPHDHADARIDAALAAGGRLVTSSTGRRTLADPEGNEVEIVIRP